MDGDQHGRVTMHALAPSIIERIGTLKAAVATAEREMNTYIEGVRDALGVPRGVDISIDLPTGNLIVKEQD